MREFQKELDGSPSGGDQRPSNYLHQVMKGSFPSPQAEHADPLVEQLRALGLRCDYHRGKLGAHGALEMSLPHTLYATLSPRMVRKCKVSWSD